MAMEILQQFCSSDEQVATTEAAMTNCLAATASSNQVVALLL